MKSRCQSQLSRRVACIVMLVLLVLMLSACATTYYDIEVAFDEESGEFLNRLNEISLQNFRILVEFYDQEGKCQERCYIEDNSCVASLSREIGYYRITVQYGHGVWFDSDKMQIKEIRNQYFVTLPQDIQAQMVESLRAEPLDVIKDGSLDDACIQIGTEIIKLPITGRQLIDEYGFEPQDYEPKVDAGEEYRDVLGNGERLERGNITIRLYTAYNPTSEEQGFFDCTITAFTVEGGPVFLPRGVGSMETVETYIQEYGEPSYTEGTLPFGVIFRRLSYCFESSNGKMTICTTVGDRGRTALLLPEPDAVIIKYSAKGED